MADTCDNLLPLFLEEFEERVTTIEDLLLSEDSTSEVSMRAVKRELHTLKGNSAAVGFPACSGLCHQLENYLDEATDRTRLVDQLLDGIQILRGAVCGMAEGRDIGDDVRQSLAQFEERHSRNQVTEADQRAPSPAEPVADDAPRHKAKSGFIVCLAESADASANVRNALAAFGLRRLPLDDLLAGGIEALRAAVEGAALLVLHLAPRSTALPSLVRAVEEFRRDETAGRKCGERRLNIVAIVDGEPEAVRRELRTAGVQYAFSSSSDERIAPLADRLFRAAECEGKCRHSLRFRDLKETFVTFVDGTRLRADVYDESFTGIAVRVLDPSPCEAFGPVTIDVHGVPMPAYVVRLGGRDERGYVTVGCRWGYSPHEKMFSARPSK